MKIFYEENFVPDENTNWEKISMDYRLSEDFIKKYKDKVEWVHISFHQKAQYTMLNFLISKDHQIL